MIHAAAAAARATPAAAERWAASVEAAAVAAAAEATLAVWQRPSPNAPGDDGSGGLQSSASRRNRARNAGSRRAACAHSDRRWLRLRLRLRLRLLGACISPAATGIHWYTGQSQHKHADGKILLLPKGSRQYNHQNAEQNVCAFNFTFKVWIGVC